MFCMRDTWRSTGSTGDWTRPDLTEVVYGESIGFLLLYFQPAGSSIFLGSDMTTTGIGSECRHFVVIFPS